VIHPARRPFPDGVGFFETMRTEQGRIIEFNRHMRRALTAAEFTGIRMPSEEFIRNEVAKALQSTPQTIGRLRISFAASEFVVTHDEYTDVNEAGFLTFSPHTSQAQGEQYKTFPYDSHYEILDEARAQGFDDAIIFNKRNDVTETAISNIAFLFGSTWYTPPISTGILPGVMRAIAIERCGVEVRNIHITEVPEADEICILGSMKIAQPIQQLGEHRLLCGVESQAFVAKMREKVEYFSVV
jgi:branched-subunit amino acid aminotransferase/4-amino-4-deoxychorismate lyase